MNPSLYLCRFIEQGMGQSRTGSASFTLYGGGQQPQQTGGDNFMNYFPNDLDLDDMPELLSCDVDQVCVSNAKSFPRVILLCFYREYQPQETQKAPQRRPETPSTENPNSKTPILKPP